MCFVCEVSVELDYLDYSFYNKQEAAFEVEYGFFFLFCLDASGNFEEAVSHLFLNFS